VTKFYRVARAIRYRVIDDEAVVIRQSEGDVLVLNEVAARVLQLAGEGLSSDQVEDRVVDEFDAPESTIRKDVREFLEQLAHLEVLEDDPTPGDSP
jgi:hypothetical protein